MTPEEQQKLQAELVALRAMNQERINTRKDALALQVYLQDTSHLLSDGDKAYFQQRIAQQQQRINSIVQSWQQAPYNVAPGRDGIYQAMRQREDALGLPHQERQEPLPQFTTISPEWKQTADQRAGQPPTAQELIKTMTASRDTYGHAQDILDEATRKNVQLSELGKQYLLNQQRQAQEGFESNKRAYEARYGALSPGSIPTYQPLTVLLTPQQLQQLARDVDSHALQQKTQEASQSRRVQGIVHPEKSEFDRQLEEKTREIYERKAQERSQGRTRGKGGPEH